MYTVFEDKKKAECPEKVLALWFGCDWQRKIKLMHFSARSRMIEIERPAKTLKIYKR